MKRGVLFLLVFSLFILYIIPSASALTESQCRLKGLGICSTALNYNCQDNVALIRGISGYETYCSSLGCPYSTTCTSNCANGVACTSNAMCTSGYCDLSINKCAACTSSTQCSLGYTCNTATGACITTTLSCTSLTLSPASGSPSYTVTADVNDNQCKICDYQGCSGSNCISLIRTGDGTFSAPSAVGTFGYYACPGTISRTITVSSTCTPETDAQFCTRLVKNCGSVTANDNCGVSRTVNCGTCSSGTCSNGQCVAAPECSDGIDNDLDSKTDLLDSGCSSTSDNDESNCGDYKCEGGETCESCVLDCSSQCGCPPGEEKITICDGSLCKNSREACMAIAANNWGNPIYPGFKDAFLPGGIYNNRDYNNPQFAADAYCYGYHASSYSEASIPDSVSVSGTRFTDALIFANISSSPMWTLCSNCEDYFTSVTCTTTKVPVAPTQPRLTPGCSGHYCLSEQGKSCTETCQTYGRTCDGTSSLVQASNSYAAFNPFGGCDDYKRSSLGNYFSQYVSDPIKTDYDWCYLAPSSSSGYSPSDHCNTNPPDTMKICSCPFPCQGADTDNDRYSTSANDEGDPCCGLVKSQTCLSGIDCNDNSVAAYPGAPEICDGIDNNCDTGVDIIGPALNCPLDYISYWKFDEGSGTTASDKKGLNPGTITGATWTTGKISNALSFDGVNDYVNLTGLQTSIPGAFSVSAWIKCTASTCSFLISFGNGIFLSPKDTTSTGSINLGTMNIMSFSNSVDLADGSWHHVVFTVPGSGQNDIDNSKMYIDETPLSLFRTYKTSPQSPRTDALIGRRAGTPLYFKGSVDELAVYNRVLTAAEVSQLYSSGQCIPPQSVCCADSDGDGYSDKSCGGTDCDDNNNQINPGKSENTQALCSDSLDNNCNSYTDCADQNCVPSTRPVPTGGCCAGTITGYGNSVCSSNDACRGNVCTDLTSEVSSTCCYKYDVCLVKVSDNQERQAMGETDLWPISYGECQPNTLTEDPACY